MVDDDAVTREAVKGALQRSGYTVLLAEDGCEGLLAARVWRPSAIICDNMMPNMTGVEMLRALREKAETRDVPVLVATGFTAACEQLVNADSNARLASKPLELSKLITALQSLTG
jgi:CheY-like chemotaxis protein